MGDTTAIIDLIEKSSKLTGVAKVTIFRGYLDGAGEVEVTVYDRGTDDDLPYRVVAKTLDTEKPRMATGNPSESLEVAMATNHWFDLER